MKMYSLLTLFLTVICFTTDCLLTHMKASSAFLLLLPRLPWAAARLTSLCTSFFTVTGGAVLSCSEHKLQWRDAAAFHWQGWLAEVEGRLPSRTEQARRQSGLYEAQNTSAVNSCAQDRERYSICTELLPLGW